MLLKTIIQSAKRNIYNLKNVMPQCWHVIYSLDDSTGIYTITLIWPIYGLLLKGKNYYLFPYTTLLLKQLNKMRELITMDHFTGDWVGRTERKKRWETKPSLTTWFPTPYSMQAEGTQVWASLPDNSHMSMKQLGNHCLKKPHRKSACTRLLQPHYW